MGATGHAIGRGTGRGAGAPRAALLLALGTALGSPACSGSGEPPAAERPATTGPSSPASRRVARATEAPTTPPTSTTRTVSVPSTTAPGHPTLRDSPAGAPLAVAVVGDSVAWSLLPTIRAAVDRLGADLGRVAEWRWGLVGPGFGLGADVEGFNVIGPSPPPETFTGWPQTLDRMVDDGDPDLVVVLLGVWDTVGRNVDGRRLAPGSREWDSWYSVRVATAVSRITARGAATALVLMPCTGRPEIDRRLPFVNLALARAAVDRPEAVGVISLDALLCPHGEPVPTLPGADGRAVELRADDGVHFDSLLAPSVLTEPLHAELRNVLVGTAAG